MFAKFAPYDVYNGSKLINVIADIEKKLENAQGKERARLTAALESAKSLHATYENLKDEKPDVPIVDDAVEVNVSDSTDEGNVFDEFEDFTEEETVIVDVEEIKE